MTKPIRISNIDWQLEEEFKFGKEQAKYLISNIEETDMLPLYEESIKFSDNRWDFRPFCHNFNFDTLVFSFNNIPSPFLNILKYYVLLSILDGEKKIQSVNRRFYDIKRFVKYLYDVSVFEIKDITVPIVERYLDKIAQMSMKTISMHKIALKELFSFYSINFEPMYSEDLKDLLQNKNIRALIASEGENRIPDIPIEYYDNLLSTLIYSMNNPKEDISLRRIACVYIILSQTGLRISEILSLETTDLQVFYLKSLNETTHYLTYKSFKGSKGNDTYKEGVTYINELSKLAFTNLVKSCHKERKLSGTDYLYVPKDFDKLPVVSRLAVNKFKKFVTTHGEKFGAFDNRFKNSGLTSSKVQEKSSNHYEKEYFFPDSRQFRVRLCTELYEKGVPLVYIQKYMSHLTDTMTSSYVRPSSPSDPQEDIAYSEKVIREVITGESTLLGAQAATITKNIQEYIEENGFNIEKDIESIITNLSKKLVIRSKLGGVCIKSSIRDCSKDAKTNEMYCAYEVCPNLFHFYYMIPLSYKQYLDLIKTHEYNWESGFHRQAEKELHKLKYIITHKLLPELEDLEKQIEIKGTNNILARYPELKNIIDNRNNIIKEAKAWMNN